MSARNKELINLGFAAIVASAAFASVSIVGTEPTVDVETLTVAASPGDLYLICSDGLTDIVRDEQIAELIQAADRDPDAAAEALVAAANRAGGIDNITVVLFEIVEGDPVPPSSPPEPTTALEPDEDTMEQATAPVSVAEEPTEPESVPVRRHGAGAGGRWLALLAIILTLAVAAMVIWWSLAR